MWSTVSLPEALAHEKTVFLSRFGRGRRFLCAPMARGQAPSQAGVEFFESKIRPILVNNCYKCHSSQAAKLKGGLSLEYHESMLKGGDSGPAIVPGNPEKVCSSKRCVTRTRPANAAQGQQTDRGANRRPGGVGENGRARSARGRQGLAGANWSKERRQHWAFQPIKRVAVPEVHDTNWVANPVDAFVLAKLEQNA
jgi:hypothetical protein